MFRTNCVTRRIRIPTMALGLTFCLFGAGVVQAATFDIGDGDVAGLLAAIQTANTKGDSSNVINLAPKGTTFQ